MSTRWILTGLITTAVAGSVIAVQKLKPHSITLDGAIIVDEADPVDQAPIGGATVSAQDDLGITPTTSTFSGYFSLRLPPTVLKGQLVTLQVHHPAYRPFETQVPAGDEIHLIRLSPARAEKPSRSGPQRIELSNLVVRYTVQTKTATNIGSGAKMFQVENAGNVPCEGRAPCSPDGKWKAAVGGVFLDAGPDNEFHAPRLSCIAGPCPFTQVDSDRFSRGGRLISATVRGWSDTTTFVLEAEVFHPDVTAMSQQAYPTILGRRLNFSLPAAAEGVTIEAEIAGEDVVFPVGPTASLSWATCEVRSERDQTRNFRCELKPEYDFKNRDHS